MSADAGEVGRRRATYRLQLSREFGFAAAAAVAGYLRDLGVSHVYCSPVQQAVPGSAHGYDVVDPGRLSDDLGGAAGFSALREACAAQGLRLLLDVVPNHMAADHRNPWWWDVLARGAQSRYARWFDIEWDSPLDPSLRGRVLLPVLADHLGRVAERGELRIAHDAEHDGAPAVRYHDVVAPLTDAGDDPPGDAAALLEVLQRQHYRLARWRLGMLALNYRRFFDITSLVGMRTEEPAVFAAMHGVILGMLQRGEVDGVRIDHVDGLHAPRDYLERLRDAVGEGPWVVVEKILAEGETLPADWPVQGTTGYEFAALSTRLLTDPSGAAPLLALHAEMGGGADLDTEVRRAKLQVMDTTLRGDVDRLALLLRDACAARPRHSDHGLDELRDALRELLAALRVYRTYAVPGSDAGEDDTARLRAARDRVRSVRPDIDAELLDLLCALVGRASARDGDAAATELAMRMQQLSCAVMAKGFEDTVLYRVTPLLAPAEVGGAPLPLGLDVAAFHRHNARIQERWPDTLLATTTHDTKRSEDVRARLALLAEMPEQWAATVRAWRGRNARHRRGDDRPDAHIEHLLYQSMVGAWPVDRERMLAYMDKASREAKLQTSWIDPSPEYDAALRDFVGRLYDDAPFLAEVEGRVAPLVAPGRANALAMLLLKLTSPGVPDVYQGSELWTLSLVDPDNRRPVDYAERRRLLDLSRRVDARSAWAEHADSGLPKLLLMRRALALRARHPELFDARGAYRPLHAGGRRAEHVVAYARGASPGAVAVVPRFPLRRRGEWADTAVPLPDGDWHDQLCGHTWRGATRMADLLADFPVALLAREPFAEAAP